MLHFCDICLYVIQEGCMLQQLCTYFLTINPHYTCLHIQITSYSVNGCIHKLAPETTQFNQWQWHRWP